VQRALGALSPSLAVATTMHHFSLAGLLAVAATDATGQAWMLLEGLVRGQMLVASGFAEGDPQAHILKPTMRTEPDPDGDGLLISGVKRPCSLARSMSLLTASVRTPASDGSGERLGIALIPAESPGLRVEPFWGTPVLAGAESDQVVLDRVRVPRELVVETDVAPGEDLDELQTLGFLWFELLMTGSYLGVASALVERVLAAPRAGAADRARLVGELEAAMRGAEYLAHRVDEGGKDLDLLGQMLQVRYAAQDAIARTVTGAAELLGGMAFIGSGDVACLVASAQALAFHPPERVRMADALAGFAQGRPLIVS
jgi:alkylation response protein AidB-like acyl-CoA dehydrogenase